MAEVFANALARQRAREELQTAYSELRQQKAVVATIFNILAMINFSTENQIQMVNRAS